MKRIIALVCTFVILISFFLNTSVLADYYVYADEDKYDVEAYHSEIWERYGILGDRLWIAQSTDEFYSFVNLINATNDDAWLEFGVNLAEEELTKMRYVEILVNLMALMDVNTEDMIANQAKADTLKTLNDYLLDATEILVEGISVSAAFGTGVTAPMKSIASTMDLTWDAAEVTINSIEVLEYVNRVQKNYAVYTAFLTAVSENADNSTLRSAADTLSTLAGKAFYCKVDAVISQSDATSEYLGKEVFFDTLLLEDMLEGASTFKLSDEDMAIIEQFKTVYDFLGVLEFSQDVAVFIADIVGGFSDCMNRYSEMRALYEIRKALLSEIGQLRERINDANNAETIGSVCDLLRNVLYVNFRGEYCFHEMVTTDGDVFSIAITKNGKETSYDELFEFRKSKTEEYSRWLDAIIPEIELYKKASDNNPVGKPGTIDDAVCFNGHYYKVYNGQSSWEDAAAFCQSMGGHLATITSEEENTYLHDYLVSMGLSGAYFGFSDVNIEGKWVWCTGEEVTFTNWDSSEPNNEGRKEHYGLFDFSHNDGKWNDGSYRSGTDANFICEWDADAPPDTGNDSSTKTTYLLKQAITYSVDYDSQPSKTKTFRYNQDGQLNGVTIETVSKRTQNGETSYRKQLLEYYLECDKSGCYTGFSASLDGSYSGKGTITCDANGKIVEFYSSETGQKYTFSYNTDGLMNEYIYEYKGEVYTHSKMQYDSRGNIVSAERIQRDGRKTESRTEIEYDAGDGLVIMTQYIDGIEQNSILQRCDTYGNVMKEEHYKAGTLVGWIEYTYESQTVPDSWQKIPDLILSLLGG